MISTALEQGGLLLAASNPLEHVKDNLVLVTENGLALWTGHMGMLVLSGILTLLLFVYVGKRVQTGPESQGTDRYVTRGAFAHMIEVICLYLRDNVVKPILHDRTDRFMPFLWTLFFFILINNLLGLVPLLDLYHLADKIVGGHIPPIAAGTATANIWVTGGLAIVAFFVINIAGVRKLGVGGYLHHLTGGAPLFIAPIMVPVEVLGTFVKPFALMVRLFANMNAGHILMATLIGMFVSMAYGGLGALGGTVISVPSLILAFAIYFLEIFVAFLQAFIFMFLTAIFIGQLAHEHHEDEDEEFQAEAAAMAPAG
jgi:F-type H+-transporting ATPase subunit a